MQRSHHSSILFYDCMINSKIKAGPFFIYRHRNMLPQEKKLLIGVPSGEELFIMNPFYRSLWIIY